MIGWAWWVDAIAPNVVSSMIVAAILYLWYRGVTLGRSARVWGIAAPKPFVGVPSRPPTVVVSTSAIAGGRPMTGIGQVRAIGIIMPSVGRAYRSYLEDSNLRMSLGCDVTEDRFGGDLVTIGGPKTNEVTAFVLERIGLPDGFGIASVPDAATGETVDRILWNGSDARGQVEVVPAGRQIALGLVVRCQNPIRGRGVLTILAGAAASGSGTFGTEAAASAVVHRTALHVSRRATLSRRRVGMVALVRADVGTRGNIPRLLDATVIGVKTFEWANSTW
jgi:hypothetical protein